MRALILKSLTLMIVVLLMPAGAYAQDANADKLKTIFESLLANQKASLAGSGMNLNYTGEISVENAGKYYAVTLPDMDVQYPDGSRLDIGMIAVNASVHQEPGQWKMTLAMPTPMVFFDAAGQESSRLNIGGQSAAGIWNEDLKNFSKLDANYENLTYTSAGNAVSAVIQKLRAVYDLDQVSPGKWSGPVYFNLDNVAISNAVQKDVVTAGQVSLNVETYEFDQNKFAQYQKDITAYLQKSETNPASVTPTEAQALYNNLIAAMGDGFTSQYQLTDLAIKGEAGSGVNAIQVGQASIGMDVTGFLKDDVTLGLRVAYDQAKIDPAGVGINRLMPATMNLDWSFENIPFKAVSEAVSNSLQGGGDAMQMGAMSLMFRLPAILSQAATTLAIENNKLHSDLYKVDINGKAVADVKAVNSATADLVMTFKGMDAVLGVLNEEQGKLGAAPDPEMGDYSQVIMGLTMLKGLGEVAMGPDGQPVYKYHFIMNPQGQMLLNGNDLMTQFGMGAPAAAPAGPVETAPVE